MADIMSANLFTVAADASVETAVRGMNEASVGAALVLDGPRLVGILTERDVLRAVGDGLTPAALVGDWMTHGPETIEQHDTVEQAAVIMIHGGFRHLPVVEAGSVVGILSIRDLMRSVIADAAPRGV